MSQFELTSSSVYGHGQDDIDKYGPQNGMDGILLPTIGPTGVSEVGAPYFQSGDNDLLPWIQIDYGCITSVSIVMITAHFSPVDNIANDEVTLRIHVGNSPSLNGETSNNQVCATHNGPIAPKTFEVLECNQIFAGQYVVIQQHSPGLVINDLIIFTTEHFGQGRHVI